MNKRLNIESFEGKTTFIVGSDKHAGKTTFLNYVLRNIAGSVTDYVYLSIGIDGEGSDVLTGMPKPKIYAETDAYIITTESALKSSDALLEIHEVLNIKTQLGYLVLVKVLRPGYIELVGPETNSQLENLISRLRNEFGIKTIFVDGAVDRLSQVTTAESSEFVYVLSVTPQNLSRVIEKASLIHLLSTVKTLPQKNQIEKCYTTDGLLNKQAVQLLPEGTKNILVNDLSSVFISFLELKNFLGKYNLYYKKEYFLKHFIVNLKDVTKEVFLKELNKKIDLNNELIIFNPYETGI